MLASSAWCPLRYVILALMSVLLSVLGECRRARVTGLTGVDVLDLGEAGGEIPVAEVYEGVDLPSPETGFAASG